MKFLLDTNVCIHLLRGDNQTVVEHFSSQSIEDIFICSIVKAELLYGARRSNNPSRALQVVDAFTQPLTSLNFGDLAAAHYGVIRSDLAARGQPIGANDLMIAAIAKVEDLIVVTNNTGEFSRVAGLRFVDWQC